MEINKIIAVDFDGTLCESNWPGIGLAKKNVIRALKREIAGGAKVILWTCREGVQLMDAIKWSVDEGIVFDAVNDNLPENKEYFGNDSRKVYATEYWDDKGVEICGDEVHGYQWYPPKRTWREKVREIVRIIRE